MEDSFIMKVEPCVVPCCASRSVISGPDLSAEASAEAVSLTEVREAAQYSGVKGYSKTTQLVSTATL